MRDTSGALGRLVRALGAGDRDAALELFAPGAVVVVSGSHHDYASYPVAVAVDGLLASFMEVTWTPVSRRYAGGAQIDEGVIGATHIGPFLGVAPSATHVRTNLRLSSSTSREGLLETLAVWGNREAVLGALGQQDDVASLSDGLVATVRERWSGEHPDPVLAMPQEVSAFRAWSLPPDAPAPGRHRSPGDAARPAAPPTARRSHVGRWTAALAVLAVVGLGAWALPPLFRSGDAAAAAVATRLQPGSSAADTTLPPVVEERTQRTVERLTSAGSVPPALREPGTVPSSVGAGGGSNAGLTAIGPSVQFDGTSTGLDAAARGEIDNVAAAIVQRALSGAIYVHGYTDDSGTPSEQSALSASRAAAVARELQTRLAGKPVRLLTAGFGSADPAVENTDAASRNLNQRVMVLSPTA